MDIRISLYLLIGCLAASAVLLPAVTRFAWIIGAVDRGGYRKMSKGEVPLLGGLAIAMPLVLCALFTGVTGHIVIRHWQWFWINHQDWFNFLYSLASVRRECLVFGLGGIVILGIGLIDDSKGLPARVKLAAQVLVGAIICMSDFVLTSVSIPLFGSIDFGVGGGCFITMLWVVGLINAFNLIDGIDGLATGMGLIGACALVALSAFHGNYFVAYAGIALAGGLLAFLPRNFPPAKMFLGDTGSMFIGYSLACMSLLSAQKTETAVIVLAPMLALSFPIFETAISMLRRYIRGAPIFVGDNLHTHHRLLRKGYSEPRVVLTLYLVGLLLSAAAVLSALVPEGSYWSSFPYALYGGTLLYVTWLAGYLRPSTFSSIMRRRNRNKRMQVLAQYGGLCFRQCMEPSKMSLMLELCREELSPKRLVVQTESGGWRIASPAGIERLAASLPEKLHLKSADGQDVSVRYEYARRPSNEARQDVSGCLAGVFDGMSIPEDITPPQTANAISGQPLQSGNRNA